MTHAPFAPWALAGESLVGVVAAHPPSAPLPAGLAPLPGPLVVLAVAYTASPVGPYLELAVLRPARLGVRPGWSVVAMAVDSTRSRLGGRLNWGLPKEVGTLLWEADGRERRMRWVERDIEVRGRTGGPPLPLLLPVRALQRRGDGPVVVPGRLRGQARLTRLEIDVPADDRLAALAGRRVGVHVAGMRLLVHPARQPSGVRATLRAPLRAPEPALCSSDVVAQGRLAQR